MAKDSQKWDDKRERHNLEFNYNDGKMGCGIKCNHL